MNERIKATTNVILEFLAFTSVLVIPLLFWNLTTEYFETPKLLALIVIVGIFALLWVVKCLLSGRITFTQTPLNLPLFIMLIVFILSTFFAPSKSLAIFGNMPKVSTGLMAFGAYFIFYIMSVSNLRNLGTIKYLLNTLFFVGVVLATWSLLSFFKINLLPLEFTQTLNFTPTGSNFSTNALLVMMLPILVISLGQNKFSDAIVSLTGKGSIDLVRQIVTSLALILFTVVIILTGTTTIYIAAGLVTLLSLLSLPLPSIKKSLPYLAAPILVGLILVVALYVPLKGIPNPLPNLASNFPRELQLPFDISWKVSVSTFRDFPLLGSGPGSYVNNFTAYKPVEFNNTNFWNIRFDSAFNEYFQVLATMGALGLFALLLLTVLAVSAAIRVLTTSKGSVMSALAISTIAFFILLALHSATLVVWVIGFLVLALFMNINKNLNREVHIGMGERPKSLQGGRDELYLHFDVLPAVVTLLVLAGVVAAFIFTGKFAIASYNHRLALNAIANGQGGAAYNYLIKAEQNNPDVDLYRLDLAQTNFALANAIAAAKAPTEASPSGSLTDADKQDIQTLLSQAISEGRAATNLNPSSALNWEVLAGIYRQISGVAQNAFSFSLDSYGRAIQRDPLNPLLRLTVGGMYYSTKNYDNAIRFYSDAVNLKPDFANGYYNLAIAFRDRGDFASAVAAAEKTVSLLDSKSKDYEAAAKLLSDLKEDKTSAQSPTPTESGSSALQEKGLPKVLDLPKVENIATPPAVKK